MRRPSVSHSYGIASTLLPKDSREDRHGRDRHSARNNRCVCQLPNATGRGAGRTNPFAHVVTVNICTMITMQLTSPDLLKRQAPGRSTVAVEPDSRSSGIPPIDQPASITTPFQPLDPGIVNEAIPAFFIGRNKDGFWLARDVKGRLGGVFLFESSALSFARRNSQSSGCATIFPSERFELDLENQGNPLIAHLGPLVRLVMQGRQRMAAIVGKLAGTIERPTRFFDGL
jgi:hypothetical protein